MPPIVDNYTEAEEKRRQLILQIQELYREGYSMVKIAKIVDKDRVTIAKYIEGDPDKLCRSNKQSMKLTGFTDYIIECINDGLTQSKIADKLAEAGYKGTNSNARMFIRSIAERYALNLAKYDRRIPDDNASRSSKPKAEYITRKGIFNHLWMDIALTDKHHEFLWSEYPLLNEIEKCIREFREIFSKKNMPLLHIFIEKYSRSSIKEIASFAKGLDRDIDAVENAVASPLSNAFVEGTNSKVKTVKKTMYGRCGIELLSAKLMYRKT